MALKNFNQAEKESGMLAEHMRAFQTVANRHDCVIACRHVGNTVTGLLRAGYATKSIAVHSKSCDWGPMAGFVCADARFTKKSYNRVNIREQRIEVKHQKVLAGTSIPIQINRRRIVELKQNWREWGMNSWIEINNEIVITASMAGKQYTFTIAGIKGQPDMYDISVDDGWSKSKVCAFTNPETVAGNYLNALTGDVDLWGVFPRLKVKQQSPNDHVRYAATAKLQEHNILHAAKKNKTGF